MPELAKNSGEVSHEEQKKAERKPWVRQEGESAMWFNRFRKYMDLGPKRTLLAAVEKERGVIRAIEGDEKPTKNRGKQRKSLQVVPDPPRKILVPGSWSRASVQWNWRARARAWDEHLLETSVDYSIENFYNKELATSMDRVAALHVLLDKLQEAYNATDRMTFDEVCTFVARMQSLLRDMREEMKGHDEELSRMIMRIRYKNAYSKQEKS